jgi:hypothetical protein
VDLSPEGEEFVSIRTLRGGGGGGGGIDGRWYRGELTVDKVNENIIKS